MKDFLQAAAARALFVTALAVGILLIPILTTPSAANDGLEKYVGTSMRGALEGIELKNLEGEPIELSSYLDKGPVIFDFWALWCKPCLAAMPELNKLYEDLEPRGLQIVGINEDGPRNVSKVKPFMRSNGYEFPVLLDLNRVAQKRLNALALPTTLLLDSEGKVLHTSFGYRSGEIDKLREVIEPLLSRGEDE